MGVVELILLGAGLSADAMAVAAADGLSCRELRRREAVRIAACFGFMQGLMPLLGFFLGKAFEQYITAAGHWVALLLLCFIGGSMIYEACTDRTETAFALNLQTLLLQGVATSIDALAVGVSLAALPGTRIFPAVMLIGGITFLLSLAGVFCGSQAGKKLGAHVRLLGGLLLIGIGIRIFLS